MSWREADQPNDLSLVRPRAKVLAREHRELKARLVRVRRKAGLSQEDVAERMSVSQQTVSKFERYDSDPKLSTLRRYANAVGALIEHQVEIDRGQSVQLAASRSAWAEGNSPNHFLTFDHGFNLGRTLASTDASHTWTAANAKRTDFALAR